MIYFLTIIFFSFNLNVYGGFLDVYHKPVYKLKKLKKFYNSENFKDVPNIYLGEDNFRPSNKDYIKFVLQLEINVD